MNRQQAFDIAAKHLLAQGKKSYLDPVTPFGYPPCAYRGEGGLKCAIGALIPDDQYSYKMENMSVSILLQQDYYPPILKSGDLTKDFLQGLQGVHDDAHGDGDVEEFRRNLLSFAEQWDLKTDVVSNNL